MAKKKYEAYFVSKVSDSDMENTETQTWIEFALACGYIDHDLKTSLMMQSDEVGRLLHHMMNNPEKYK